MSDSQISTGSSEFFAGNLPKWSHVGPPWRPLPEDTAVVERAAAGLGAVPNVVVLGLTPETTSCNWPVDTRLTAVDHSPDMIKQLWPPAHGPANSQVMLADWHAMPIDSGTIDLVAGDGCYMMETFPEGFDNLTRAVCRVLGRGGRFVIRVFLRPDQPESVADIARAFARAEIGSVHALKMRLMAAVHGANGAGFLVDEMWQAWKTMPPLPAAYAGKPGWGAEEVDGMELLQGSQARFFMPTLTEFRQSQKPFLREVECSFGHYELADLCPTFVFAHYE